MITELIDLANAELSGLFNTIGKAYSMKPLDNLEVECPALLFMPGGDNSEGAVSTNPVRQVIKRTVSVFIIAGTEEVQGLADETRKVIFTYKQSAQHTRLQFESGGPQDIAGKMWWVDNYFTEYDLRSA